MTDERRQGTLDTLLGTVGELKAIAENSHVRLDDIKVWLIKQDGRIGKLESWRAFILGITAVLVVLVVPIVVRIASDWLVR